MDFIGSGPGIPRGDMKGILDLDPEGLWDQRVQQLLPKKRDLGREIFSIGVKNIWDLGLGKGKILGFGMGKCWDWEGKSPGFGMRENVRIWDRGKINVGIWDWGWEISRI